jgi:hypothetical protein
MGSFYSEVYLQLYGLLEIGMKVTGDYQWKYLFKDCKQTFKKYLNVADHIENDHLPDEKLLYANLSSFGQQFSVVIIRKERD